MKKIKLFDDLNNYLIDLNEILLTKEDFLKSKKTQYSVSMLMMNIINCCIDIGTEIITLNQLGYPNTYRDVFKILEKNKIIDNILSSKMQRMVGLRNILAHDYGEINMEILFNQSNNLSHIKKYIKKVIEQF